LMQRIEGVGDGLEMFWRGELESGVGIEVQHS